jgi:hypothetical protein
MDTEDQGPLPLTTSTAPPSRPQRSPAEREIAIRVAGLLAHYWTPDTDPAAQRAQILDWIADLKEFPVGAVEGAIVTWRRTQSRRPAPADIRKLILPDPKPEPEGGAAYNPLPRSRLTFAQRQKHRNAVAPFWDLVRRARNGEDAEMLIAERRRMSREMFERDPELQIINALVEQEAEDENRRFSGLR